MHETDYLTDPYTEAYGVDWNVKPLDLINRVIDDTFSLPNKAIQLPIIQACIVSRSKHSQILPLICCYGASGTGKSQLGKLVAGLYQLPSNFVLAGKTTPVAIRNLIQTQKFGEDWHSEGEGEEENALLVWDDINLDILRDSYLLSILKSGYSRKSANIAIAQAGGINMYFNCFALKYTSTIHPFWSYQEFNELTRRILIFPHANYFEFSDLDKMANKHPDDLVDIDYVSFEGYKGMTDFDPDILELQQLGKIRRSLRALMRNANFPSSFGKTMFDIMSFGVLFGVFSDTKDAIAKFEAFYPLQSEALNEKTEFDYWLDRYLTVAADEWRETINYKRLGEPLIITRIHLQRAIDKAIRELEIPNAKYSLAEVMRARGWKLIGGKSNTFEKHV